MDFNETVGSVSAQLAAVSSAPVPFIVSTFFISVSIWLTLGWFYKARLERLTSDNEWLNKQVDRLSKLKTSDGQSTNDLPREQPATPQAPVNPDLGQAPKPQYQPDSEVKIWVPKDLTLKRLVDLRASSSDIRGDRSIQSYKGKWIHFSGPIIKTGHDGQQPFAFIVVGNPKSLVELTRHQVSLWFDRDSTEIDHLLQGDVVNGSGKIETVNDLGGILVECTLDKVVPASAADAGSTTE